MNLAEEHPAASGIEQSRRMELRLEFLDGLRGFAALYVAFHHVYYSLGYHGDGAGLNRAWAIGTNWLGFGNASVALFIVLSGFCLMLPLARRRVSYFPEGLGRFFIRRSWRILPPYYGAMALSLLLIAFVPGFGRVTGGAWDESLPAFTPGVLLSHVFLVHNLSVAWISKIDYPMWTVSTEWETYFVFALLLLPTMKRLGAVAMTVVAFALGFFLDRHASLAHFDFIGLFALGMVAAHLLYTDSPLARKFEMRMPWGLITLTLLGVFLFLNRNGVLWYEAHSTESDIICGLLSFCAIIYLTHVSIGVRNDRVGLFAKSLLESRVAIALGAISYSLYLIHAIVIVGIVALAQDISASPQGALGTSLFITGPLCVGAAYVFYCVFERPALQYRSRLAATTKSRYGANQEKAVAIPETHM